MTYDLNTVSTARRERSHQSRTSVFGSVFGALQSVRTYFRDQRDYRQLLQLPDHLLDDLGLTPVQIRNAMKRRDWSWP